MDLRMTTFIVKDKEIYVLPASSSFSIKKNEIFTLIVFLLKSYVKMS